MLADRFAEPDEWFEAAAGRAAEQRVEQQCDVLEAEAVLKDLAYCFFESVGAPDLAFGCFERVERRGLRVGEVLGFVEQRPAGVLEALGGLLVAERSQLVPVRAADLVQRLIGELDDVVWVDVYDRLGCVLAG